MWATASRALRSYWLEILWGLFAAANIAVMLFVNGWETIPFHNVWVTLALLYCVRRWNLRVMAAILLSATVVMGAALTFVVAGETGPGYDELAEVPMMAAMFLVTVFYAWMHQQAVDELKRSALREREFVRDISHYLRTPITIALGHAELIRESSTDEQLAEDAAIVVEEVKRVSTISDRLLLLATPEDHLLGTREEVDPGLLVEAAARRWDGAAPREWNARIEAEGTLLADGERLTLALDCLIENAVRATAEGDAITIRAGSIGGAALLEVSDTGPGISTEDQRRIFKRFERGSRSGNSRSGAGLGLALAKAIVEAHGGALDVESTLGEGATFRMRLGPLRPHELPVVASAHLGNGDGDSTHEIADAHPRSYA